MRIDNRLLNIKDPFSKKQAVVFFIRIFVLFSVWFAIYGLILRPTRIIDRPLTNFITDCTTKIINLATPGNAPVSWVESHLGDRNIVMQNGKKVLGIFDVCNGIDLMFIYIAIIFLMPATLKKKVLFSLAGVFLIIIANIIRVTSLYFIYVHFRAAFNFSHHYFFTICMYILIFYGWILFLNKGVSHAKKGD